MKLQLRITSWGNVALDKAGLKKLMRSAGNDVKTKTARIIAASHGTGREYYGGGGSAYRGSYRRGRYRASAPGNPPVMVTGSLHRSLRSFAFRDGAGFAVRAQQFYSLFLEAGAKGGGNFGGGTQQRPFARRHRARASSARVLEPRPFLDRVMQEQAATLDSRVERALYQGLTWRETKTL